MYQIPEATKSYKLSWSASTLTVVGQTRPSYDINHVTGIFSSGPEFTLTSRTGANPGAIVRTIDWHSLSQKVKMKFPSRDVENSYRALNGHFDAHGALGRVEWKATGMKGKQASWQLSDAEGRLLSTAEIHSSGETGMIEIWKPDLHCEAFGKVLLSSLARIEDYRRLLRNGRRSAIGAVASATGLGFTAAS